MSGASMIVLVVEGGTGELVDDEPFAYAMRVDEAADHWEISVVGCRSFEVTSQASVEAALDALSATVKRRLAAGDPWWSGRDDSDPETAAPLPDTADPELSFACGTRWSRHRAVANV